MRYLHAVTLIVLSSCAADDVMKGTAGGGSSDSAGAGTADDTSVDCEEVLFFPDGDGDGYGDSDAAPVDACDSLPLGVVDNGTDCDDDNPNVNPGAAEVCDALDTDENCDGLSDDDAPESSGKLDYAPDMDGDGYGDETAVLEAWCDAPSGMVADASDCDDTDATIHPGASEEGAGMMDDPACDGGGGYLFNADIVFGSGYDSGSNGHSLNKAGDVDGDGLGDVMMVSYPSRFLYEVSLFLGSTLAVSASSQLSPDDAQFHFIGEPETPATDIRIGFVGDVDGDGLDELMVGEDTADYSGRVHLFYGSSLAASTSSIIHFEDADLTFSGLPYDRIGRTLTSAGDVDGDGLDDLLIGGIGYETRGFVALVFARTINAITSDHMALNEISVRYDGEADNDHLSVELDSLSGAGDVDGDGLADLLVGAYWNREAADRAGKSYLILGASVPKIVPAAASISVADFAFTGEDSFHFTGYSVAMAGDVDGDGYGDILIGSGSAFKAYLFRGRSILSSTDSTISLASADIFFHGGDSYTTIVGEAGDVDGDGLADILIGSPENSDGTAHAGKSHLILGRTLERHTANHFDLSRSDFGFMGTSVDGASGCHVFSAGDVNGDGLDEIVIEAEQDGPLHTGYLIFGQN